MNNYIIVLIVVFGLVNAGILLVLWGTVAKNRWGINVDPGSCPRCNTPFPRLRDPQNVRQALWGGGTCVGCGSEFDKWGREVNGQKRGRLFGGVQPEGQVLRLVKRRLIVYPVAGYFCLTLLFGWLGIRNSPSALSEWVAFAGVAVVEAAIFAALFYVTSVYVLNRFVLKKRGSNTAQDQGHE